MLKTIFVDIVAIGFVLTVVGQQEDNSFNDCVRQKKGIEGACEKIIATDLVVIVDDSEFRKPEKQLHQNKSLRDEYTAYYQKFIKKIVGESGYFKYGENKVQRAVLIATSYGAYIAQTYADFDMTPDKPFEGNFYDLDPEESQLHRVLKALENQENPARDEFQKNVLGNLFV